MLIFVTRVLSAVTRRCTSCLLIETSGRDDCDAVVVDGVDVSDAVDDSEFEECGFDKICVFWELILIPRRLNLSDGSVYFIRFQATCVIDFWSHSYVNWGCACYRLRITPQLITVDNY
jgi:hypothetical protein